MANSKGFFATQSYLCVSHRRCFAHQLSRCDLWQSSLVQILGGCVHECREELFTQSNTDFSSISPRCVWSSRKSPHIVHSMECLHVMRMMKGHIFANLLWIHVKCVHPLRKLGHDFWWRGTLTSICCHVWSRTIQNNQKSEGLVSNLCRTMIQEDEISKFFCSQSTHTWSVWSRFRRNAKWTSLYHMLVKVINLSRNVQVSCSLLEMCRIHVVMLQLEVLQVANIQQLVDNFQESFTICFLPKLETSSDRSREVPDTSCSSVADGSRLTEGPFLLRNGVGTLRIKEDSRFSTKVGCTKGSSSSSSETVVQSERTRGLSSSSSSSFWTWAGYADLHCERAKITYFAGGDDRSRNFGWYARLVKSYAMCPIVEYSTGEEYKPTAGHVILAPFGSSSSVIPRFCICGKENGTGTSPVPSTSAQVEHGGFVGKWTIKHSRQVSVFRVGKHKRLIARTEFCCDAIIQRIFLEPPDCLSWSNRSCLTKDPKQRVSDGGQDPR